jgi:hypothetical protein
MPFGMPKYTGVKGGARNYPFSIAMRTSGITHFPSGVFATTSFPTAPLLNGNTLKSIIYSELNVKIPHAFIKLTISSAIL